MKEPHHFNSDGVCTRCGNSRTAAENFGWECSGRLGAGKPQPSRARTGARAKAPAAGREGRPSISDKVQFWEEQDRINQALIPRVLELHEAVRDLHKRTADVSGQIAAAEARVLQRIQSRRGGATPGPHVVGEGPGSVRYVAYASFALALVALSLSLYQAFN